MEQAKDKHINFLDISISNQRGTPEFGVYRRKPTTTDSIIPFDSNHPPEHKLASIHFLLNRLYTYPMSDTQKIKERIIIDQIMINNKFPPSIREKLISTKTRTTESYTNHELDVYGCNSSFRTKTNGHFHM
jgi:hypothetical protein